MKFAIGEPVRSHTQSNAKLKELALGRLFETADDASRVPSIL